MSKALLVLLVLFLGWTLWKKRRRERQQGQTPQDAARAGSGSDAQAPGPINAEAMLPCACCGLHVPAGEALLDKGLAFCSADHLRRGRTSRG